MLVGMLVAHNQFMQFQALFTHKHKNLPLCIMIRTVITATDMQTSEGIFVPCEMALNSPKIDWF